VSTLRDDPKTAKAQVKRLVAENDSSHPTHILLILSADAAGDVAARDQAIDWVIANPIDQTKNPVRLCKLFPEARAGGKNCQLNTNTVSAIVQGTSTKTDGNVAPMIAWSNDDVTYARSSPGPERRPPCVGLPS
jgi:hypothetical protein